MLAKKETSLLRLRNKLKKKHLKNTKRRSRKSKKQLNIKKEQSCFKNKAATRTQIYSESFSSSYQYSPKLNKR
jgi:hypothetical protein